MPRAAGARQHRPDADTVQTSPSTFTAYAHWMTRWLPVMIGDPTPTPALIQIERLAPPAQLLGGLNGRRAIADVEHERKRQRPNFTGNTHRRLSANVLHRDAHAGTGEAFRQHRADAVARAGHQRKLARKRTQVGHRVVRRDCEVRTSFV